MTSRDSFSSNSHQFSASRITAKILKTLLVVGVVWVVLTVAFAVVGALTSNEGTDVSSQRVVPNSIAPPMPADSDYTLILPAALASEKGSS